MTPSFASARVAPVEGRDDLFAFQLDFVPEGKAVEDGTDTQVVTELDDGDLLIEGYAAVWEGTDRDGENFAPGAFSRGVKAFLESNSPSLCFHHKRDKVLGRVLDLREEGKGLKMKARVDGAIRNHPELKTYYEQIKKGTLNALSIGGFFTRGLVEGAQKIINTDFTEISVTGVPVHTGPSFQVVAGKALVDDIEVPEAPAIEGEIRASDLNQIEFLLEELKGVWDQLESSVAKRSNPDNSDPAPAAS